MSLSEIHTNTFTLSGAQPNPDISSSRAFQLGHGRPGTVSLSLSENDEDPGVKGRPGYSSLEFLITTGERCGGLAIIHQPGVLETLEGGAAGKGGVLRLPFMVGNGSFPSLGLLHCLAPSSSRPPAPLFRQPPLPAPHSGPGPVPCLAPYTHRPTPPRFLASLTQAIPLLTPPSGPGPVPRLDGINIPFGRVLEGMGVVSTIVTVRGGTRHATCSRSAGYRALGGRGHGCGQHRRHGEGDAQSVAGQQDAGCWVVEGIAVVSNTLTGIRTGQQDTGR